MDDMSVEEAQALLQGYLDRIKQQDWTFHIYDTAIRIVLDELKALQECESCRCSREERDQS